MINISYLSMVLFISIVWFIVRSFFSLKVQTINIKREAELLLVYLCIIVIVRFTFFPLATVDGNIPVLSQDLSGILPLRINFVPLVHLFDYPTLREAWVNIIGNVAMFIPVGIVWPLVFRTLNTPLKAILSGAGFSLTIEMLQLPFRARVSDIDDLILNSLGFIIGYSIFVFVKKILFARIRRYYEH